MKRIRATFILLMVITGMAMGCAVKLPHTLVPEYEKVRPRLIGVLPIACEAKNEEAARILRMKVIEGLYFKGYPRVSLSHIDEKLSQAYGPERKMDKGKVPPATLGRLLGVDAVMYVTLEQCSTSYVLFYAPTHVVAAFELVSTKTGETLWSTRHSVTERIYGFTKKQLELNVCLAFEPVLQDVVDTVMATLPDGPDA